MSTENFYADLPTLNNFIDITDSQRFVSVPNDWYIIITDIIGSTAAIKLGRYKDVNLLGACSIIAILNIARNIEIPFVFGGDGASMLIPPTILKEAKQALLATQDLAATEFRMRMRLGFVPVGVVSTGYELKIAKLKISENYSQAVFRGGGMTYATHLVKDVATSNFYKPKSGDFISKGDFSGLECRWKDIPSRHEEIVALLVNVTAPSETQTDSVYKDVINQIHKIYGQGVNLCPVTPDNLNLSLESKNLLPETQVFTPSKDWLKGQLYLLRIKLENLLGMLFMHFKIKAGGVDWGNYTQVVSEATDHKKFDDMLRMIISGNPRQRDKLLSYLEKKFNDGRLVYGYHISASVLMTCLVFERNGRQVHFVDGADGGYAIAAISMKQKMKA